MAARNSKEGKGERGGEAGKSFCVPKARIETVHKKPECKTQKKFHLLNGDVRDLSRGELTELVDLVLEVVDPVLEGADNYVLFLELLPHVLHFLSQGPVRGLVWGRVGVFVAPRLQERLGVMGVMGVMMRIMLVRHGSARRRGRTASHRAVMFVKMVLRTAMIAHRGQERGVRMMGVMRSLITPWVLMGLMIEAPLTCSMVSTSRWGGNAGRIGNKGRLHVAACVVKGLEPGGGQGRSCSI